MVSTMKKILFLTGTRADYGKLKGLIKAVEESPDFEAYVYVCGMHLLERFGGTYREVLKDEYDNTYVALGLSQSSASSASVSLGDTVRAFSSYVDSVKPDMIVVHGDRMDALAGAVVGALTNVLVAHVEGGELSGTIDESIRHAISKFAHVHLACNEDARRRLLQLGEDDERIFVIGSADVDLMLDDNLPTLEKAKARYGIPFANYGILMYHPVTTEVKNAEANARAVIDAVIESGRDFVVIYPNSDLGYEAILSEYKRLLSCERFRIFPSLRFEYFLSLLKGADLILGNSSAGVRESGVYGIPAIDIGTRQKGRYSTDECGNIQHVGYDANEIIDAIVASGEYAVKAFAYGKGNSVRGFMRVLESEAVWSLSTQKQFNDRCLEGDADAQRKEGSGAHSCEGWK
ncbi:UDP-N-acetylglucosamine 2-epimerase [Adlercreutzia sp. ZJ138]|uniref:UDP-N-acetylglucosamine 2-epimerase n=1 Tax=Adlercreutzia sp. ZJ138 TaxID=2709405 RepID=UPI00197F4EBA|nr:UDP-N-acetylglucosamine 2-epimerase [Adlercreutzia sp. ZJ138]